MVPNAPTVIVVPLYVHAIRLRYDPRRAPDQNLPYSYNKHFLHVLLWNLNLGILEYLEFGLI